MIAGSRAMRTHYAWRSQEPHQNSSGQHELWRDIRVQTWVPSNQQPNVRSSSMNPITHQRWGKGSVVAATVAAAAIAVTAAVHPSAAHANPIGIDTVTARRPSAPGSP